MARARAQPPARDLTPTPETQFKKDVKRLEKQRKDLGKLRTVIETLCARRPLAASHRDHSLGGDWKTWRDCHLEPDWILIYKQVGDELRLARTGSHAELFG